MVRMWRNRNPWTLLVRMQNGTVGMENNVVVPYKFKNRTTIWSRCYTFRCILIRIDSRSWRDFCAHMFIAALFTKGKWWKQPQCPSPMNGWMYKQTVVYTSNGILFSTKKKGNSGICCNMHELWRHDVILS